MGVGLLMSSVLRVLRRQLRLLKMTRSQYALARTKRAQRKSFQVLCHEFSTKYGTLKQYDTSRFTTRVWEDLNEKIESTVLPCPAFSFLRNRLVAETMVSSDCGPLLQQELAILEHEMSGERLKLLLEEDYVGNPRLVSSNYLTSHNSIHHLCHLATFVKKTHARLDEIRTVVEWGGGYGNLSKLFRRLSPATHTYIIIDTPLFSCVQWLYLSTILGVDRVRLLQDPRDGIHSGQINLLPVCFLDHHELSADLFVSTWALSESSELSQDYVAAREWFKSRHLLIAYHASSADYLPASARVGTLARASGARVEAIHHMPGNYYAFR